MSKLMLLGLRWYLKVAIINIPFFMLSFNVSVEVWSCPRHLSNFCFAKFAVRRVLLFTGCLANKFLVIFISKTNYCWLRWHGLLLCADVRRQIRGFTFCASLTLLLPAGVVPRRQVTLSIIFFFFMLHIMRTRLYSAKFPSPKCQSPWQVRVQIHPSTWQVRVHS